jgi:flavin-dependent dehydrogenase
VVCNRRVLDHQLLLAATSRGVKFVPNFVASELQQQGDRTTVVARDGRTVQARYVMVAGGAHCKLGVPQRPRRLIQAIMGWWDDVPFRANHLEMVFDKMVAPYYGWLFPESDTRVNIGITYEDPKLELRARDLFQRFLDKHYGERLAGATQVGGFKGHPIAYSYKVEKLTAPGRIVIGEAGLMTHPATAEGIYQGMRSGMLGADAVASVISGARSEARAFAYYERRCRLAFQLSFLGGSAFRAAVQSPVLDWVVRAGEQPMIKQATARLMAAM